MLTETVREIPRVESLVMNQARQSLEGELLITLRPRWFGLIASLFFKDRRHKGRQGFDLMGMCPGQ